MELVCCRGDVPGCGSLAGWVARSEGALPVVAVKVLGSDAEGIVEVEVGLVRVREIAVDG